MPRITSLLAVSFASVAFATGGATAETRAVNAAPFTSASFESGIAGSIVVGKLQSITIEAADPATLEDIRVDVVGGKLRVWRENDLWDVLSRRDDDARVTISVPSLDALLASSAARVEARGLSGDTVQVSVSSGAILVAHDVTAAIARLDASSAGQLTMTGSCQTAHVQTSGAGQLSAGQFECVDMTVQASSASKARLFASGLVTAEVSSAATIELAGSPKHVDDAVSSGGDVEILQ